MSGCRTSRNGFTSPAPPPCSHVVLVLCLLGSPAIVRGQAAVPVAVTPVGSIGVLEGDPQREFGHLIRMDVDDERGVLFLLDRLNARLSAFTRDGEFLAATGGQGEGPDEYRYARAVVADGPTVHVWDPGNLRISTYEFDGASFALSEEIRTPFQGWDMCGLGGDLFVLKWRPEGMIHRIDPEGNVVASFGRAFRDEDEVMANLTDMGLLLCDPATRSIFLTARAAAGTLRRYSLDGDLLWEVAVPGMVVSTITRNDRGGVTWRSPPGDESADTVVSLVLVPGGRLLVQYGKGFRGMGNTEDIVEVESVLFDVTDGSVIGVSSDLPRIDFASGDYAYAHANDPFPRAVIYEWR